jgi:hypothetical protein
VPDAAPAKAAKPAARRPLVGRGANTPTLAKATKPAPKPAAARPAAHASAPAVPAALSVHLGVPVSAAAVRASAPRGNTVGITQALHDIGHAVSGAAHVVAAAVKHVGDASARSGQASGALNVFDPSNVSAIARQVTNLVSGRSAHVTSIPFVAGARGIAAELRGTAAGVRSMPQLLHHPGRIPAGIAAGAKQELGSITRDLKSGNVASATTRIAFNLADIALGSKGIAGVAKTSLDGAAAAADATRGAGIFARAGSVTRGAARAAGDVPATAARRLASRALTPKVTVYAHTAPEAADVAGSSLRSTLSRSLHGQLTVAEHNALADRAATGGLTNADVATIDNIAAHEESLGRYVGNNVYRALQRAGAGERLTETERINLIQLITSAKPGSAVQMAALRVGDAYRPP